MTEEGDTEERAVAACAEVPECGGYTEERRLEIIKRANSSQNETQKDATYSQSRKLTAIGKIGEVQDVIMPFKQNPATTVGTVCRG